MFILTKLTLLLSNAILLKRSKYILCPLVTLAFIQLYMYSTKYKFSIYTNALIYIQL